jgi:protocatechuate 3,4-dioxygenase beta subunit
VIDIWQCDALGRYPDVHDLRFDTSGQKFLRGAQHTDKNGLVQFLTIYPGRYSRRTVRIHLKVRTDLGSSASYESNTQPFFDDALSDAAFALPRWGGPGRAEAGA